jgi:hypothetical protein
MGLSSHPADRVPVRAPVAPEHQMEQHWYQLMNQGYTVVNDVIPPPLLDELREYFDEAEACMKAGKQIVHSQVHSSRAALLAGRRARIYSMPGTSVDPLHKNNII